MEEKPKEKVEEEVNKEEVGRVETYLGHVKAIIIDKLAIALDVGDKLELQAKEGERFVQEIKSMQINKEPVEHADAGTSVGVAVDQPVRKDTKAYKIQE